LKIFGFEKRVIIGAMIFFITALIIINLVNTLYYSKRVPGKALGILLGTTLLAIASFVASKILKG